MIWSAAFRAESIMATSLYVDAQGRCPEKWKLQIPFVLIKKNKSESESWSELSWLCATPQLALVFSSKGPRSAGGVGSALKIFLPQIHVIGKKRGILSPGRRRVTHMGCSSRDPTLSDTWWRGRRRAGRVGNKISAQSRRIFPQDCMCSCCKRQRTTCCQGCKWMGNCEGSNPSWSRYNLILFVFAEMNTFQVRSFQKHLWQ